MSVRGECDGKWIATTCRLRGIAQGAMMVNSYYGIYQAERGKSSAEIRAAEAQMGGLAAGLGHVSSALVSPVRAVRGSLRRQQSTSCSAAPDAG